MRRRVTASTYAALSSWSANRPDFDYWESAALELVRDGALSDDARLLLGASLLFRSTFLGGDAALTGSDIESLHRLAASPQASPLARLRWLWIDAQHAMRYDEDEELRHAEASVAAVEALGAELGITSSYSPLVTTSLVLALHRGDLDAAERAHARLVQLKPTSPHDAFRRLFFITWFLLWARRPDEALRSARELHHAMERCPRRACPRGAAGRTGAGGEPP